MNYELKSTLLTKKEEKKLAENNVKKKIKRDNVCLQVRHIIFVEA